MEKNSISSDLTGIMMMASSMIKKVETGAGLGLTKEQRAEFKKKYPESEAFKKIAELKQVMDDLPNKINAVKNGK